MSLWMSISLNIGQILKKNSDKWATEAAEDLILEDEERIYP